jgi:nucleoside-diphosphate-sugar epimerase
MAKVLVAGAGGYIGVPLCKRLVERGHTLIALDRFFFGRNRIDEIARNERAAVIVEDIRDFDPEILRGVAVVVDLAGLSNDASAEIDPELTRLINCGGGIRLARLAKEAGVRRYVYSSSASVYGHGVREHLTEHDECRPQTLYAESKLRVEEALAKLAGPGFETVVFRNSTVFGLAPRMRFDLAVNIMTLRAWKERVIYVMGSGMAAFCPYQRCRSGSSSRGRGGSGASCRRKFQCRQRRHELSDPASCSICSRRDPACDRPPDP